MLNGLLLETEAIPGVDYVKIWLSGNRPSFVDGLNSKDQ